MQFSSWTDILSSYIDGHKIKPYMSLKFLYFCNCKYIIKAKGRCGEVAIVIVVEAAAVE